MTDYNRNPTGVGGFQPGHNNPGGRPKGSTNGALYMLKYWRECADLVVKLMREGDVTKADFFRFARAREVMDRGAGKPAQSVALGISVDRRLDEMSLDELEAFRTKYLALTTMAPAAIDAVLEADAEEVQPELEFDVGLKS